ncbi:MULTISPECIES: 3-oxoacyl-[acyl-carrier-protein] reductase [unclassified Halanaerobium]|uniref:3-oxoacyl-[acyl-carrier-protein] reductase n=1 Tax=unclassified Halanaerobium TaxID=2641197 RepID=UPI000DF2552F|nr:3-oxoacyl-[acyl-carrier-protein] reductase [Halanaerobium sp. MA284_MarDTE_T2]RCW89240.1 3-oxoacyl-[acyl-carrier-protein] reductase [Halanaerobium sp. DL-01]
MIDISEKKALVTGSSRGIGAEIVKKLAEAGAEVVINYANSKDKADNVKNIIKKNGGRAHVIQADVSNFDEAKVLVEESYKLMNGLDILINNAGITTDKLLLRMKEEDWDKVVDINLKGVFNCTKHAVRYLLKSDSGRIINISSVVALMGNAGQANYCAAKAGIIGFTRSNARELAGKGVRVNAVAPGYIMTEMTEDLKDDIKDMMLNNIPVGRFGKAEEVANVVLFLASSMADYINGQVINVDGGMLM